MHLNLRTTAKIQVTSLSSLTIQTNPYEKLLPSLNWPLQITHSVLHIQYARNIGCDFNLVSFKLSCEQIDNKTMPLLFHSLPKVLV